MGGGKEENVFDAYVLSGRSVGGVDRGSVPNQPYAIGYLKTVRVLQKSHGSGHVLGHTPRPPDRPATVHGGVRGRRVTDRHDRH